MTLLPQSAEYGQHQYQFDPSQSGYTVLVNTDPHPGVTSVELYFDDGEWTEYVAPYSTAGGEGEDNGQAGKHRAHRGFLRASPS